MMKKSVNLLLIFMFCLLLAACGNGNSPASEAANGEAASPAPAETGGQSGAQSSPEAANEKLIVYTNSNSDGRGEWLIEKAKAAGFEIEIVGAGGADLTNRLIAEKNNPIADVVFGLNSMLYEILTKNDVLEPFTPEWAGEIEEGLNDPDGYYHSLVKQAILLAYNPEKFTSETAPKDWTDLWNKAEYHGLYEAPTLLGQVTPRIVVSGILTRYQDPSGEYGISDEGWAEIKKFYDNGVPAVEGEDFYSKLASGQTPIGALVSGVLASKEKQYGVKSGIASPEIGVPVIVEQTAIVKGTKKRATAERFINWLGSAETQGEFAKEFNSMPANTKAAEQASEDMKKLYASIKTQTLDWAFIAENIDNWAEKIELQVLK
ncbi:extracellular solute-binding protein [Paenibacillus sophorae]|uniref:Extracellular solute-binding protein n=2 Tax=Paenibacillus sophorae TaxID=1333845 RepID=A0ABX8HKH9_9BACL|nr:extracellular solute-binding protein [Paenibacillus sophorae]QWU18237.1 extracellular solute-binding protein [Paenibacillus sophorae]